MFDASPLTMSETMTVMPRGSRTWAPLYRHPGPRSPPSFTGAAAKATAPSLADLLRQDQLRVDHIHWRLSESEGGVGVPKGSVKEPVRFGVAYLHDQPVIRVRLGSESKSSEVGIEFFFCSSLS